MGVTFSLTVTDWTVPLLTRMTRSAMPQRALLWVMMITVIPVSRQDVVAGLYRDAKVESAEYGSDAVSFYQDWGFNPKERTMDIACLYSSLKDSETEHRIYLVFDDVRSNTDTLYLELHHQGHGESYENEAYEAKNFQVNTTFLRFDLGGVIPADAGKQIVFSLEWDWLPTEDDAYLREQKHFQVFSTVKLSE